MFLRSQLVSRFPVSLLRLCCNTGPSTSNSESCLLTARFVPSRRHSHVIASSAPQLANHFGASLVWVQGGGRKDWKEANEVEGALTRLTDDSSNQSSDKGGEEPIRPNQPNKMPEGFKTMMMVVLGIGSLVSTLGLDHSMFKRLIAQDAAYDNAIPSDAPQVDFAFFAEKYLNSGEVQKITFVNGKGKAVATLFPGAIIDGEPAQSDQVVINYAHTLSQFRADVRKEEAEMGIFHTQEVDIQSLSPVSPITKMMSPLMMHHLVMKRLDEAKERKMKQGGAVERRDLPLVD